MAHEGKRNVDITDQAISLNRHLAVMMANSFMLKSKSNFCLARYLRDINDRRWVFFELNKIVSYFFIKKEIS